MHRRKNRAGLFWALVLSLLINHGLILPVSYLLFTQSSTLSPAKSSEPFEVEIIPQPPEPKAVPQSKTLPRKLEQLLPPERLPAPVTRLPEEKKPEPEKKELLEQENPEPAPQPTTARLKMVEVNNPESERPPENARFLSDKNRKVEQETRARHTNLVKDAPRPEPFSRPNPEQMRQPGSRSERIAETRTQQGKRRQQESIPKKTTRSPLMVMRPERLAQEQREKREPLAEPAPDGTLRPAQRAREQQAAESARLHYQLNLDHHSLDRIDGESARRARELARLSPSTPRGRHDQRWQRIRSALENFIPEVRPGNQTALGTRADPFALYIARMHRGIHKYWGFGFLEDLDRKPDSNPLNDANLWTMIEIVVRPDGQVDKTTIVKPSGILPFDVAALDTVYSSGPYPPTPRAIRSADGNVYLHWRFHRDHRQCGTFGVDPFILTTPPKGPIDSNMEEVVTQHGMTGARRAGQPGTKTGNRGGGGGERGRRGARTAGEAHVHGGGSSSSRDLRQLNRPAPPSSGWGSHSSGTPRMMEQNSPTNRPAAPQGTSASSARITPRDPAARSLMAAFLRHFTRGDAAKMASLCALPFLAQGKVVTRSRSELQRMLADLVREAGSRRVTSATELMTVTEARGRLGYLPLGAEHGAEMLVGQATLDRTPITLILERTKGKWKLRGLNH